MSGRVRRDLTGFFWDLAEGQVILGRVALDCLL